MIVHLTSNSFNFNFFRKNNKNYKPRFDAADGGGLGRAEDHVAPLAPVVDPRRHRTVDESCAGLTNGLEVYSADVVVF